MPDLNGYNLYWFEKYSFEILDYYILALVLTFPENNNSTFTADLQLYIYIYICIPTVVSNVNSISKKKQQTIL